MEESLRKLALWYTKTFKPIMTHDELEPIMTTLGFVGLPLSSSPAACTGGVAWKEYVYSAGGCRNPSPTEPLPRPRLPYPRIDGLHTYTYRAFIDAVTFYIGNGDIGNDISDIFHIRGMPLHRIYDRPFDKKFRRLDEEESIYVFREGTLDQATFLVYDNKNNNVSIYRSNNVIIHSKANNTGICNLVPLKDIIV
ncbi:PREDICTED: uncharacterized protein LOC104590071 [Nelumbo nucifera]|uniref:Uncharacterized protein LOC104590071 n=2 Tax=Nelumbo nucifera TaxID=4432 RepID=A0A1U7Z1I3_NELNU|nr:PREDICTED: uncharacterized protein LOC104590071 [Nelumbo nucifera]DAD45652.1 TPA_asm: hypothetical protein HUJ06_003882 [Nelumbo nucifera]